MAFRPVPANNSRSHVTLQLAALATGQIFSPCYIEFGPDLVLYGGSPSPIN
jgi:hypothetical protein